VLCLNWQTRNKARDSQRTDTTGESQNKFLIEEKKS
jgi:hypothetical protein